MVLGVQHPNRRVPRAGLWEKIELLKIRTPGTNDHAAGSWAAFTAFTGISRETLRDGCLRSEDGTFLEETITERNEATLGRKYGFDPTCNTWVRGSALEFRQRWFPEPANPAVPILVALQIAERTRSIDPHERVYVALSMQRDGGSWGNRVFDAELVCQVFTTKVGVRLAVRRGLLRVCVSPRVQVPPMSRRLGGDGGVKLIMREANKITIRPGGRGQMHWDIEADEAPLGVTVAETNSFEPFVLPGNLRFRAAIAFNPPCRLAAVRPEIPALILIGALDEWTPAVDCSNKVAAWGNDGPSIELVVYPGAHHGFYYPHLQPGRTLFGHWVEYNCEAADNASHRLHQFLDRHLN